MILFNCRLRKVAWTPAFSSIKDSSFSFLLPCPFFYAINKDSLKSGDIQTANHPSLNRYLVHSYSKSPTCGCLVTFGGKGWIRLHNTTETDAFVSFKRKGPTKDLVDDLARSSSVIEAASFAGSISAWCGAARRTLWQDIEFLEQRKCATDTDNFQTRGHVCLRVFCTTKQTMAAATVAAGNQR